MKSELLAAASLFSSWAGMAALCFGAPMQRHRMGLPEHTAWQRRRCAAAGILLFSLSLLAAMSANGASFDVERRARSQAPDKLVAGANWQWSPKAQLRMQATHLFDRDINIGRRAGTSNLEEHFKGYTLVDLSASWETRHGSFGVDVENLFDKQYTA